MDHSLILGTPRWNLLPQPSRKVSNDYFPSLAQYQAEASTAMMGHLNPVGTDSTLDNLRTHCLSHITRNKIRQAMFFCCQTKAVNQNVRCHLLHNYTVYIFIRKNSAGYIIVFLNSRQPKCYVKLGNYVVNLICFSNCTLPFRCQCQNNIVLHHGLGYSFISNSVLFYNDCLYKIHIGNYLVCIILVQEVQI